MYTFPCSQVQRLTASSCIRKILLATFRIPTVIYIYTFPATFAMHKNEPSMTTRHDVARYVKKTVCVSVATRPDQRKELKIHAFTLMVDDILDLHSTNNLLPFCLHDSLGINQHHIHHTRGVYGTHMLICARVVSCKSHFQQSHLKIGLFFWQMGKVP